MPARRAPLAGDGKHDEAEREYRQTHEFESQYVHGQIPKTKSLDLLGAVDRCLIWGCSRAPAGLMLVAGLTI